MTRTRPPFLPHQPIPVRAAVGSALVGVGLVAPLVVAMACLPLPRTTDGGAAEQQRYLDYAAHPGPLFLKAVLLFPLAEEVFYRGIILPLVRRYGPEWLAILFSAAFFGVTHLGQGAATALNAFLLGCLFGWLVIRSRSLYPSIVCHAAFNFSWLFVAIPGFGLMEKAAERQADSSVSPLEIFPAWWIVASVGMAAMGILMVSMDWMKRDAGKSEASIRAQS